MSPGLYLRETFRRFSARGARFLGAAVAFYALLSAAPLFLVVLHIVGAVFGRERAESALWDGLARWLAPEGLAAVRGLTERLEKTEGSTGILGGALVVYASTRLFRALHRAINHLWEIDLETVEAARPRHVRYALRYGRPLLLTLFVAVMVTLLLITKMAFAFAGASAFLWALDTGGSVVLTFALFVALFRALPEAPPRWGEAAVGAAASTLLFAVGSALVTLYVQHKRIGDLYDGAGALVIAVLWVYYSTQVFFLGACATAALRTRTPPTREAAA
jgi:membrane protein